MQRVSRRVLSAFVLLALTFTAGIVEARSNQAPKKKSEKKKLEDLKPRESFPMESGVEKAVLVELFSSEGCSSCPPAEEWFNQLTGHPGLWQKVVPVVFHVDYWDRLGWKDSFSTAAYTKRQRAYSKAWKSESIYTPNFVVNGSEWKGWFSGQELDLGAPEKVGVLSVDRDFKSNLYAEWDPEVNSPDGWEINAVLLGFGLTTRVTAGENSGRILPHDFVVLDYIQARMLSKDGAWYSTLKLGSSGNVQPKRFAMAFWVTRSGSTQPVQAVGGFLE